jgi:hypothetical protein
MSERKPHREICAICHEVSRVGFHVPDEIWELATHRHFRNSILCLRCFTRLADERSVEWDKDIQFYPVSWITHCNDYISPKGDKMSGCEHTQIEKETACYDGLCPICQAQRIGRSLKILDLHNICEQCGKQLSKIGAGSFHTCYRREL